MMKCVWEEYWRRRSDQLVIASAEGASQPTQWVDCYLALLLATTLITDFNYDRHGRYLSTTGLTDER